MIALRGAQGTDTGHAARLPEGSAMTHSFNKEYWNEIWHGNRAASMAAGDPNPHLV